MQDNDFIRAGMPLSDDAITPSDILSIEGPGAMQEYLVNGIQEICRLQGVKISDKHIEVVVNQMMQKVVMLDAVDGQMLGLNENVIVGHLIPARTGLREYTRQVSRLERGDGSCPSRPGGRSCCSRQAPQPCWQARSVG